MEGPTVNFTWKEAYHCWHSLLQLAHKMSSPGCAFYHLAWCLLPTKWLERVLHMLWADQVINTKQTSSQFSMTKQKHKMLGLVITNSDCSDFSQLSSPRNWVSWLPESGQTNRAWGQKPVQFLIFLFNTFLLDLEGNAYLWWLRIPLKSHHLWTSPPREKKIGQQIKDMRNCSLQGGGGILSSMGFISG